MINHTKLHNRIIKSSFNISSCQFLQRCKSSANPALFVFNCQNLSIIYRSQCMIQNFKRIYFKIIIIMSAAFAHDIWKDSTNTPSTPMSQPYTQSVARKKLQHYSYLLTDSIGKGYSSQVFRGRNDLTNQTVAIKVINMAMVQSDVHQALLASQIECLRSLVGVANIIQLYEVYTTKNNTYIITEMCEDGDLSKIIKKKRIQEQRAVQMIEQLVTGYLEIYRKGMLHRDLKPANVFMKGDILKIADFGFAMKVEDYRKTANYNVGSPLYMPPEALVNNKYSFKSDIWALGVIFFEMLTGKAPWKAKSQQDLARKICSEPIQTLLPSDIGQFAAEFLTKTLQSDVNSRMGPEQLERFSFSPKYYIDLKTSMKFQNHERTRSLMKSSRNLSIPKIDIQTPKNSFVPTLASGQKSSRQTHQNTINSSSYRLQAQPQRTDRYNRKQTSNQLLTQIHFCRFLFKLIGRINQTRLDGMESLKQHLANLLAFKLGQMNSFERYNIFQIEGYRQYKETNDFKKIMSITKQYEDKYKEVIDKYAKSHHKQDYETTSQQIVDSVKSLYSRLEFTQSQQINEVREQLVLLDYLITTYQLVELSALKDLAQFHKKSKIQAIVQGNPTRITAHHLKAVREKMTKLQLI